MNVPIAIGVQSQLSSRSSVSSDNSDRTSAQENQYETTVASGKKPSDVMIDTQEPMNKR